MIQFETDVTDLIQEVLHLMEQQRYSKEVMRKHREHNQAVDRFSRTELWW